MSFDRLSAALQGLLRTARREAQAEAFRRRLRDAYPAVHFDWPLKLQVDEYAALEIGRNCVLGAFSEIVVLRRSPCSTVPGRLVIGDGVGIGIGANLRAAGGTIRIGCGTQVGQHVSMIASNHARSPTTGGPAAELWDAERTGVTVGDNCWIGAGTILLPGVSIGSDTVIGAGSVITKSIGAREVWVGNPARPLRPPPTP